MNLSDYIADADKRAALAKKLRTNPQYLWQLASGWRGRKASPSLAKKIESATGGQVTKESLRPDIWDKKAA